MEKLVTVILREKIESFTISRKYIKRLVRERLGDAVHVSGWGIGKAVNLAAQKGILILTDEGLKTNDIFAVDVHRVLNGVEAQ
jgi:hypothetical protein